MAQRAKEALKSRIYNKTVYLEDLKKEKYGRLLAKVYYNGICMNDWMIKQRYAVPYDGGKKKTPRSWKRYKKTGKLGRMGKDVSAGDSAV